MNDALMLLPLMVTVDDGFDAEQCGLLLDTVRGLDEGTIQLLMGLAIADAWEAMEVDGLQG